MFNFFKKKTKTENVSSGTAPEEQMAPGTEIRYHPDLIAQLLESHRDMDTYYQDLLHASDTADYPVIEEKLQTLRKELHDHLLTENVLLYAYMEASLAEDAINHELIREFRREMNGIAKSTMDFLKKYAQLTGSKALQESFRDDLFQIGKILKTRLEREEKILYPLYRPLS